MMLLEPISAGLIVLLFLMGNKHSIKMVILRIAVFIVAMAICGYQLFRPMPVGNAQVMVITWDTVGHFNRSHCAD
ncbi:hypothetical protein FMM01_14510 [Schleiferilactobacillus harbinensis]|uniref:hypothetical protein n=1 Tax=Schleiferilactobacillus harbinensis TaxID=304207 RepID=UPI0012384189|nr:hypothetical protein [Schleiferilactobacillus harbinensis]QEU48423.1 hypothetical protein FMM01_14510 [Schleiferilactobacillus harbinensis]